MARFDTLFTAAVSGRAAQAYAALGVPESRSYTCVKLAAEAYRQKFWGMRKRFGQTYGVFADELSIQLDRWCSSSEVESYDEFRSLFLFEQFKNCLPEEIEDFLADYYLLVHKMRS